MDSKDRLNLINNLIDSETPIMDRRITTAPPHRAGKNTRLSQNVWFSTIFELNELNAMRGLYDKVLTDRQIMHNWQLEFGHLTAKKKGNSKITPGGALLSGKHTLGMYRKWYRSGKFYSGQLKPILYAFRYAKDKFPRRECRHVEMLNLNDCRSLCLEDKIADPRFFSPEEILKIKRHAIDSGNINEWSIPSRVQWQELDASVAGGIYNAFKLYDIPYDPTSWSPPEDD